MILSALAQDGTYNSSDKSVNVMAVHSKLPPIKAGRVGALEMMVLWTAAKCTLVRKELQCLPQLLHL